MSRNKLIFQSMSFDLCGELYCSQHDMRDIIVKHGGTIVRITDNLPVNFLITSEETLQKGHPKITKAKEYPVVVPILDALFVRQCVRAGRVLPASLFALPGKPSLLPPHIFSYGYYHPPATIAKPSSTAVNVLAPAWKQPRTSLLAEHVLDAGYFMGR
jgi:hypothetical protein